MAPAAKSDSKSGGGSVTVKKRKASESSDSKSMISSPKVSKASLYADITQLEEVQADKRPADGDARLYAETCEKMRKLLDQVLTRKLAFKEHASKVSPTKEMIQSTQQELTELRTKFSLLFLNLKKLNRLDKLRTRKFRESTLSAKQSVDSIHLQLQNLRYEVLHLQKEVAKCLQFRSRDQDFELIPVEEFYEKAVVEISKPDVTRNNKHEQRLARLEFENIQRKEIFKEHTALEEDKAKRQEQIREKRNSLANLKPQLAAILEKTKSVQKYLEMPLDREREQLDLAKYLPHPLFVLFSEMKAYGYACDKSLQVLVKGDIEEAKFVNYAKCNKKDRGALDDDDDEGGNGDEDDEDQRKSSKKSSKNRDSSLTTDSKGSVDNDQSKTVFAVHPLVVEARLDIDPNSQQQVGNSVEFTFCYLTYLEVIGVQTNLNLNKDAKTIVGTNSEVLSPSTLFCHLLCEEDYGNRSPNPATVYQLKKKLKIENLPTAKQDDIGSLFQWAQKLGGLNFPEALNLNDTIDEEEEEKFRARVDETICQTQIEKIVCAWRERFVSRLALQKQISMLEKAKLISVELAIPQDMVHEFPATSQNRIRAWSPVAWEDYASLPVTRHLVDTGAVASNDFFYRLQLNREPASLIALIAVGADYPYSQPVFCLNLHWNGEHNLHNSENVRALEREVNTSFAHLIDSKPGKRARGIAISGDSRYDILSLQVRRLMTCLDVLLESWNSQQLTAGQGSTQKPDFPKEKLFLQPVRGRRRGPPLKYQHQMELFTQ